MSCLCIGGPNCCMLRGNAVVGPFKCPDCSTWWTGEHRCPPPIYQPSAPQCTCQRTPTGLIPTTVNCPIHGMWTYTETSAAGTGGTAHVR